MKDDDSQPQKPAEDAAHQNAQNGNGPGDTDSDKVKVQDKDQDEAAVNGKDDGTEEGRTQDPDADSELSEPGSIPPSPPHLADEIVVSDRAGTEQQDPEHDNEATEDEDHTMEDATPTISPYPKRKRLTAGMSGSETKNGTPDPRLDMTPTPTVGRPKAQANRRQNGSSRGVVIGHWRDSPVPYENRKHAVIGFIDIRDRLRTRIQGWNLSGEHVSNVWPLASRTGASWVTFDRIYFLPHLVGLDQVQVKEYVRLRFQASEPNEEAKKAAELEAVREAIRIVNEAVPNEHSTAPPNPPLIAYGGEVPEPKRRKTSGSFTPAHNSNTDDIGVETSSVSSLHGTRPTRILLGCWTKSTGETREDKLCVFGILGQNDMFRVKLVRENRNGHYKDDNFPQGAGALWIPYEEVDFDPHLKNLSRAEIKEYCRVRQWQIDQGEGPEDQIANETKAVYDAQTRVSAGIPPSRQPNFVPIQPDDSSSSIPSQTQEQQQPSGRTGIGGQELRSSRRVEAMAMAKNQQQQQQMQQQHQPILQAPNRRHSERMEQANGRRPGSALIEPDSRPASRNQDHNALQRTSSLAQREIARAEAAQGRADLHAVHRERVASAAAQATNVAAAAAAATGPVTKINGGPRFYESEDVRRLNDVWARQESMRVRATGEDAKIYDGIKYERKFNGPFMGKLVSQGTIINIDGEDYVEYRVLTKPSFF